MGRFYNLLFVLCNALGIKNDIDKFLSSFFEEILLGSNLLITSQRVDCYMPLFYGLKSGYIKQDVLSPFFKNKMSLLMDEIKLHEEFSDGDIEDIINLYCSVASNFKLEVRSE